MNTLVANTEHWKAEIDLFLIAEKAVEHLKEVVEMVSIVWKGQFVKQYGTKKIFFGFTINSSQLLDQISMMLYWAYSHSKCK